MSKNISSYDRKKPEIKPDTPSRSSRLIKEAGWFVLIAITLYFLLIFLSYDKTDPGWSHASQITHISNLGGRIGAFIVLDRIQTHLPFAPLAGRTRTVMVQGPDSQKHRLSDPAVFQQRRRISAHV